MYTLKYEINVEIPPIYMLKATVLIRTNTFKMLIYLLFYLTLKYTQTSTSCASRYPPKYGYGNRMRSCSHFRLVFCIYIFFVINNSDRFILSWYHIFEIYYLISTKQTIYVQIMCEEKHQFFINNLFNRNRVIIKTVLC